MWKEKTFLQRNLTRQGFAEASSWLRGDIAKFKAEREAGCVSLDFDSKDVPGGGGGDTSSIQPQHTSTDDWKKNNNF